MRKRQKDTGGGNTCKARKGAERESEREADLNSVGCCYEQCRPCERDIG